MDERAARGRILDAAQQLFYARGIRAVGMAEIRETAGVSLKRLYQCFSSKDTLIAAYLDRHDRQWHRNLDTHIRGESDPHRRLLAVFDFLSTWFDSTDFHGCAFINAFGELGAVSDPVATITQAHKNALRARLVDLTARAGARAPEALADQFVLLIDGAIVSATIQGGGKTSAEQAKLAALTLLNTSIDATD